MALALSHTAYDDSSNRWGEDSDELGSPLSYAKLQQEQARLEETARKKQQHALESKLLTVDPATLAGSWHVLAYVPGTFAKLALGLGAAASVEVPRHFAWDAAARTLDVSAQEKEASKGKAALVTRRLRLKAAEASSAELHAGMTLKTRLGNTSVPLGTCLVLRCSETRLLLGSPSRDVLFILARDAADAAAVPALSGAAEKEFGYWELNRRLALVKPSEKGKKN